MSTTTETGFLGEEVPQNGATTESAPDTAQDLQEQQPATEQEHEHDFSVLCAGNGCVQTPPRP
jgi:hypothetical protein